MEVLKTSAPLLWQSLARHSAAARMQLRVARAMGGD